MDYLKNSNVAFKHIVALPLVWMFLPLFLILDLLGELYHRICFPLYGLPYVQRRKYIRIDRHKLKYLTLFQKASCAYCGYANGLLAYWVQLAAYTEKYWCGIMHQKGKGFVPPAHHAEFKFTPYGSERAFKDKYQPKLKK